MQQRKILYICGCAEPGKSGVGDYTVMLAREICRLTESQARIVALNDEWTQEIEHNEDRLNPDILIHRLPASAKSFQFWLSHVQAIVDTFQPDWISLQYVGYAYNKYGIPNSITRLLKKLTNQAKLHIMFHELWEGFGVNESFKQHLRGRVQKLFVEQMLTSVIPEVCHTQNHFYLKQLRLLVHDAKYLPLFGNIDVKEANHDAAVSILSKNTEGALNSENRSDSIIFAFFGSIYPNWPKQAFADQILALARDTEKSVILLSIGNLGATREEWEWVKGAVFHAVKSFELGFLGADEISLILQEIDYGVATTPFEGLGKSGSFITMQEHGKIVFAGTGMLGERFTKGLEAFEPNARPIEVLCETVNQQEKASHFGSRLEQTVSKMIDDLEINS
jgi:hypothetical protein